MGFCWVPTNDGWSRSEPRGADVALKARRDVTDGQCTQRRRSHPRVAAGALSTLCLSDQQLFKPDLTRKVVIHHKCCARCCSSRSSGSPGDAGHR